jgi:hypothetical protein
VILRPEVYEHDSRLALAGSPTVWNWLRILPVTSSGVGDVETLGSDNAVCYLLILRKLVLGSRDVRTKLSQF